jgi:hypothetical protein
MLQAGRSRVRNPMRRINFFLIYLIHPAALCPGVHAADQPGTIPTEFVRNGFFFFFELVMKTAIALSEEAPCRSTEFHERFERNRHLQLRDRTRLPLTSKKQATVLVLTRTFKFCRQLRSSYRNTRRHNLKATTANN